MTGSKSVRDLQSLEKGVFVALEGIDGAGKTTQAFLLKQRVEKEGFEAVCVKEPTSGPWGQKIKEIAQRGRKNISLDEELNYFIFDREEDVRDNITPALNRGSVVIADRYYYSNIAYQSALGLDPKEIRLRNAKFPVPDLVIIFDISPELGRLRITDGRSEQANTGYEQLEYLALVKKAYEALCDSNIVRLDGALDVQTLKEQVWQKVSALLTRGAAQTVKE
ncbi:MAG: dTMP kinase [Deltaproteobacteria bacterium]|nr:dTMP kinase [Deltaproteobacteria bacterium]MBW2051195.1 dTMP kinase [Deltaproteobacteria bacterium]MBW2139836.1 dTMP kinase [Deltaproteobacteria bacterium]MBW2322001.1 dTMP kinase [Deltaproteobacteria bacterium]